MHLKKALNISAAALAVGVLAFLAVQPGGGPAVGTPAPEFRLADLSGRTATLAEYKGKVVLLDFWATWCSTCEAELPDLKAVHRRFAKDDFVLLAASLDEGGPEVVARYASEKALPYRVLFGDQNTAGAYRIFGLPTKYLIDRDGIISRKYLDGVPLPDLERDIQAQLDRRPS
ncbi:MAG: TlpA family protein disulfide reductase [Elusimicrobia bacterium]|nr:TlpA family protein disulfide reductase [Elusimicrobiota bacterium]